MSNLIARRYTFGNDEFSLEAAYHDCKLVFDGITDDDSFQEADTGLILYYANEIIYALQEALEGKDANIHSSCSESPNNSTLQPTCNQLATDCKWISCNERLPEEAYPVIVTWKNDDPASYYQYILGKHYVGVAHYKNGKWFWYSSVTEDILMEYGRCDSEEFDEAIKVLAWTPLPESYKGE